MPIEFLQHQSCVLKKTQPVMPISLEQWRASVGSNNAAHSHVLAKCVGKKPPVGLLGQYLLFLAALFAPGVQLATGKTKTGIVCRLSINHSSVLCCGCAYTHNYSLCLQPWNMIQGRHVSVYTSLYLQYLLLLCYTYSAILTRLCLLR